MKRKISVLLTMVLLMSTVMPALGMANENIINASAVAGVRYKTHVQDFGWETNWVTDGDLSGTVNLGKRLEALQIELTGSLPQGATIETSVHVQNKGGLGPFAMGTSAGTSGQSLRLESIKLELKNMPGYTLKYNVHVQNKGWLKDQLDDSTWFKSGESAGSSGEGLRLESIRIKLVQENDAFLEYQAVLETVEEADYTPESWVVYRSIVEANLMKISDPPEKIKIATGKIVKAQKNLVKGKNLTRYKAVLSAAVKSEYTEESWLEYQKVLDANVVSQLNTQKEIDKATANILEAQKMLQRKVDFTRYQEALAAVREPDYTADSWLVYQRTLLSIVVTENSSQTEVDAATQKVIEAQKRMVRKYDFSAYNALLEAVKQEAYTDVSWAIYEIIVSQNIVDLNNTQSEIEEAIKNIEAAQKEMIKASNLIAYQAALSVAAKSDYTTASWLEYQKVVQAIIVTKNHTQAEVDAATEAIIAAQKMLVRVGVMAEYDELLLSVKRTDYTTKSWEVYQKVINDNYVTPTSGQIAIDAAILKIAEAQRKLVLRGDLTKYMAAREACKESEYTSKSWAVYKKVLDTNIRTYDDTQAVINTSTAKILEAQKLLIKRGDLTAYRALIDVKAQEQDLYTIKSWTAYQAIVRRTIVTGDNSQAEIDKAIETISAAQNSLILKGDLTEYQKLLAQGEALKATSTTTSWKVYEKVVNANKRTTEDAQELISKSIQAITDAQLELVPIAAEYQVYLNLVAENAKKKIDYRKVPWSTYEKVVTANRVTAEDSAEKIAAAITAIQTAWGALNVDGLIAHDAYAAYESLKSSAKKADYTAESWVDYEIVIKLPANIVNKENSKLEIEAAIAAITAAQTKLIPVGRFDEFMKAISLYSFDLQTKNAKGNGEITQRYIDYCGANYPQHSYYQSWDFYSTVVKMYANFDNTGKGVPNAEYISADADKINTATRNILTAKNAVKTIIDMTPYYTEVAKVPLKEITDQEAAAAKYTKSSLSAYLSVYNNIENTLMAEPIKIKTSTVVLEAAKQLAAAQQFLKEKPQIGLGTKFGNAVEQFLIAKAQSALYTKSTWEPYETAYNSYITGYSVEKNTQTEYDLAGGELEKLRGALVKTPEASAAEAAETALSDYETKSAATVDFLIGANQNDATSAKTEAEAKITAYKNVSGGTVFDARKTAADLRYNAASTIKTAHTAATTAKTGFEAGITPATTAALKTALENLTTAAVNNSQATATVAAANTYVTDTKAAAKTSLENAFEVIMADQTTHKGKFSVTAPWLVAADCYDPTKFSVTVSDSNKLEVVAEDPNMIVRATSTDDIGDTDTVIIKPSTANPIETYFGLTKQYTIALKKNDGSVSIGDPFEITSISTP
ncbi:hypothetical protein [uncultured Acetobacterium sp.]|uniref:hypothetical protein n=1 Tax=uncultured Acetobacterium sp. TaxID=217139 RepID=UPI0025F0A47D|nr:hypothetical protein [uncultured Acetobacterium sp.]